jgi:hypothetical protein
MANAFLKLGQVYRKIRGNSRFSNSEKLSRNQKDLANYQELLQKNYELIKSSCKITIFGNSNFQSNKHIDEFPIIPD